MRYAFCTQYHTVLRAIGTSTGRQREVGIERWSGAWYNLVQPGYNMLFVMMMIHFAFVSLGSVIGIYGVATCTVQFLLMDY
jgi:hypothetical protein